MCYHSQCLCKLRYARNGKNCLAGWGEEGIYQLRVAPWWFITVRHLKYKQVWGALRQYQRNRNQARKRNFYSGVLLLTWRTVLKQLLWGNPGRVSHPNKPVIFPPFYFPLFFTLLFRMRACWGLVFPLLWLCLHLKKWCVLVGFLFSFLHQDSYCLLNSQWNYYLAVRGPLPRRNIVLATASHNAMKSPVPSFPWDSIWSNTPGVNHLTIKHCLFLAMKI